MSDEAPDPQVQEHEFFDVLYQQWSQTTDAETGYWMPEENSGIIDIVAVDQAGSADRKLIASDVSESDADFICGLHGAIPDLIRRLHEALDLADRKDTANDIAQGQLAEALLENHGLKDRIHDLERQLDAVEPSAWADLP
ncbi:hypothetical protein SEA_DARTHPHADER_39 [Mycobacterium phage DarthPhader]|uniref:Uncharacterized protein n=1 Tax=Mycobacterium phage DarthPhader TaxID=1912975 RepID=A0A1I9S3Y5_9CAUD|nr:hypothetical protein KIV60_gp62 [Mycobacterium phage DarthPhader]AOZ61279.1 hypothetical protein SEA_DARTHPHADER_39 [Mycobacterium phage DarthPhader]